MYLFLTTALHYIAGPPPPLTLFINTKTYPESDENQTEAETFVFEYLSSDEVLIKLAEALSEEFNTLITLGNVTMGSIKMDMHVADLSLIDYIKHLSDQGVLTNIIDNILMTPSFVSSCVSVCQAEDVAVEAVIEEESYRQIKLYSSEWILTIYKIIFVVIQLTYFSLIFSTLHNFTWFKQNLECCLC